MKQNKKEYNVRNYSCYVSPLSALASPGTGTVTARIDVHQNPCCSWLDRVFTNDDANDRLCFALSKVLLKYVSKDIEAWDKATPAHWQSTIGALVL